MTEFKQVIIIRKDLKLPKGKLAAQVAHASVEAVLKANKDIVKRWRLEGMKKVVLKVDNKEDLFKYIQEAKDSNIVNSVITDAGKTVVAPGTVTCGAIGPAPEEDIDSLTEDLQLL